MCFYLMLLMDILLSKGFSNIYYWEKLTFSKLRFCRKENLKKCTSFEEQKGTSYIRENVYFGIIAFSCPLSTKLCLRCLLICFVREIKGSYQSSLRNKVDFRDMMNVSPNILAKNNGFADERAMITTTLLGFSGSKTFWSVVTQGVCLWNKVCTIGF